MVVILNVKDAMVNKYKIEYKIKTLASCAVMNREEKPASFEIDGIEFSHWDFNFKDGWMKSDAWIAEMQISAANYLDAINNFIRKLEKIIPRISFISQSYTNYIFEPFMVYKIGSDVAFLRYVVEYPGCGLAFRENEQEALAELLKIKKIPDSFYYYWNDAVNTTGYSSKLLIMFSAIEALAKNRDKETFKKPVDLYLEILGKELTVELFSDGKGLRNRLIHGDYFKKEDNGKDYLKTIHDKIVYYFNNKLLSKQLIQKDIVRPQRHFFGNKEVGDFFLKCKGENHLYTLKGILEDFNGEWAYDLKNYEQVDAKGLNNTY